MDPSHFWDSEIEEPTHTSWMAPLEVRHYINEQISGDRGVWPIEWLQRELEGRVFSRALSIGCGTGVLERQLIELGICRQIDAFDVSIASVQRASRAARESNLGSTVRYFVSDFNRPAISGDTYDAVFFHQSLHHVAKLEKLLRAVLSAVRPNAVIYLDEYIGPSRTDWNERRLEPYQDLYVTLPPEARWFDYMPFPVEWNDWSEAVRSAEIVRQLGVGFHLEKFRGYGGNVLSVLWPALIQSRITPDDVARFIDADRAAVAATQKHFHAVMLARPKTGFGAAAARVRYFVMPKIRWVLRKAFSLIFPLAPKMKHPRRMLHPDLSREEAIKPYRGNVT
jgi:SAM-dependent methyltransferase